MRIRWAVLLVGLLIAICGRDVVQACGDKFLLVGRGVRFQRAYAAVYPASILIYASRRPGVPAAIREPRLQASLKAAGHMLAIVEDPRAFEEALQAGQYDLVIGDIADATALEPQARTAPLQPTVLFVTDKPSTAEAEALAKRYNCRLTASDRAERYLSLIDDTMKARVKDGRVKTRRAL